jgi:hypothetical protein
VKTARKRARQRGICRGAGLSLKPTEGRGVRRRTRRGSGAIAAKAADRPGELFHDVHLPFCTPDYGIKTAPFRSDIGHFQFKSQTFQFIIERFQSIIEVFQDELKSI